jgi:hypothetical protein
MSKILYSETYNALRTVQEVMALVHHAELTSRMAVAAKERRDHIRCFRKGYYEWLNHASCGVQDSWGAECDYRERKYQTLKSAVRLRDAMLTGNFAKLERVAPLMELVELIKEQKESKV